MYKLADVTPYHGGESWLLVTPEKTALIDSGFAWCGAQLVKNIERELDGRELDYIILTHSHYDHVSGSPHCRRCWPKAVVVGSEYAQYVFTRPGAIATIRDMNKIAAERANAGEYEDLCGELSIDRPLKEGDTIDLGSVKLRAISTPGHTKCSMSFMCDAEKFLIASESMGFPLKGRLKLLPGYIIGYQVTIDSIKKVLDCAPEKILYGHLGIIEGEACREYLDGLLYWAGCLKDGIVQSYKEGKTPREILDGIVNEVFGELGGLGQPREALELNLSYMVPMILNECADADERPVEV